MAGPAVRKGIWYATGIPGKYWLRVREEYVAGPAADLISARRYGALKLDLILRGIALLPAVAAPNQPGHIPRHRSRLRYETLHDLCRSKTRFSAPDSLHDSSEVIDKKRTWVREQLQELERRDLVRRQRAPNRRRPDIVVLRDRGDGKPFDDPDGKDGLYITVLGGVLASDHFPNWGATQLAAYLCATKADRDARSRASNAGPHGSATWFRQADWFNGNTPYNLPETHIAYPFSTVTIQRGLRELRDEGLIETRRTTRNPLTGGRFTTGPRMVYTNQFHKLPTRSVPFT